jgi:hypothetical protein
VVRLGVIVMLLAACGRENFELDAAIDAPTVAAADHDGDGIPNTVDRCPTEFDPMQLDMDADGVGDNCDPRPTMAGDRLAGIGLFSESFGVWIPDAIANWSLAGGSASTTAEPDATAARLSFTATGADPTLRLAFIPVDYGPLGVGNFLNVRLGSNTTGNWMCELKGPEVTLNRLSLHSNGSSIQTQDAGPYSAGQRLNVTMSATTAGAGCGVAGVSAGVVGDYAQTTTSMITIEVLGQRASFVHAAVYVVQ